jgi:hypothetical protein
MNDDDFIRERVQRIKEIAKDADPFIKKRLADLANSYERRLSRPTRPPELDRVGNEDAARAIARWRMTTDCLRRQPLAASAAIPATPARCPATAAAPSHWWIGRPLAALPLPAPCILFRGPFFHKHKILNWLQLSPLSQKGQGA